MQNEDPEQQSTMAPAQIQTPGSNEVYGHQSLMKSSAFQPP